MTDTSESLCDLASQRVPPASSIRMMAAQARVIAHLEDRVNVLETALHNICDCVSRKDAQMYAKEALRYDPAY